MTTFLAENFLLNFAFGFALLTANLMARQTAVSLFGDVVDTTILTPVTACGIFASMVVMTAGIGDYIFKERRALHFVIAFFVITFVYLIFSLIAPTETILNSYSG